MNQGTVALIGLGFTAVALIVSLISLSRRQRDRDLLEAENRGKMEQRMTEVERDVNQIGLKTRKTDENVSLLQQSVSAVNASIKMLIKSVDDLGSKMDRHMEK